MAEAKTEAKVSSKAMEAAMVARLFKDAMESGSPIVGHFVWERDDGQSLDFGLPKTHPSFPNPHIAKQRLEQRIGQWVSGEKPGVDKNAIARLEAPGLAPFDFSMESFEKAALADDGSLIIGVGISKGVGREPMEISKVARLRLYSPAGEPIGRRQALLPIKEIINIQKKEREAQAKRLASQEQQIDEGVDLGRALALEEDRQWADMNQAAPSGTKLSPPRPQAQEDASPPAVRGYDDGMLRAMKMMDLALTAVGKNMGTVLGANPLPVAEAKLKPLQTSRQPSEQSAAFPVAAPQKASSILPEGAEVAGAPTPEALIAIDADFEGKVQAAVGREAPVIMDDETEHSQIAKQDALEAKIERVANEAVLGDVDERSVLESAIHSNVEASRDLVEKNDAAGALPSGSPLQSAPIAKAPEEFHVSPQDGQGFAEIKKSGSQVRVEVAGPKIDPEFLRAVFPELPDGVDEILLTVDKSSLFDVLESLEDYGRFEMRLASKGDKHLSIGICVPAGKVAILSEFVARFSRGGIMVKRHS